MGSIAPEELQQAELDVKAANKGTTERKSEAKEQDLLTVLNLFFM